MEQIIQSPDLNESTVDVDENRERTERLESVHRMIEKARAPNADATDITIASMVIWWANSDCGREGLGARTNIEPLPLPSKSEQMSVMRSMLHRVRNYPHTKDDKNVLTMLMMCAAFSHSPNFQ